jgi:hypothetical protein
VLRANGEKLDGFGESTNNFPACIHQKKQSHLPKTKARGMMNILT